MTKNRTIATSIWGFIYIIFAFIFVKGIIDAYMPIDISLIVLAWIGYGASCIIYICLMYYYFGEINK